MLDRSSSGGSRLRVVVGSVGSPPSITCHEPPGGDVKNLTTPMRGPHDCLKHATCRRLLDKTYKMRYVSTGLLSLKVD